MGTSSFRVEPSGASRERGGGSMRGDGGGFKI